ncbi:MAG: DUF3570 domain-containing protein [Candidatus Eisenbacteria bacterium]
MQLGEPRRASSLRGRLTQAVCVVLAAQAGAAGASSAADVTGTASGSGTGDEAPKWQFDAAGLVYGEAGRAKVVEPNARITRLFANGARLSGTLGLDLVTGASPTGGIASTEIHTTTSASGRVKTDAVGIVPTNQFQDHRGSLDLEWTQPYTRWLTTSFGSHVSREKDYRSLGGSGKVSFSLMRGLLTFNVGGGYDSDEVEPTGGVRVPLSDGTLLEDGAVRAKHSRTALIGLSRVLSRRWMVGVDVTRMEEDGYLTEPYKVVSVVDPETGDPVSELTESRPSTRLRHDLLASSVYHFDTDILYASQRFYWDDWGIVSTTTDLKYRKDLYDDRYIEPHIRFYAQSKADFFHYSLVQNEDLPRYASADGRLGTLRTATLGATYGFRLPDRPGEWAVRAEYMSQWGSGHPTDAIGNQQNVDLAPPVSIGSVVVAYSLRF